MCYAAVKYELRNGFGRGVRRVDGAVFRALRVVAAGKAFKGRIIVIADIYRYLFHIVCLLIRRF